MNRQVWQRAADLDRDHGRESCRAAAVDGRDRLRAGLGTQALDPGPQVVSVEEGVGDAGFALDGLEGDELASLEEAMDRLVDGLGFRF
jgi:hypothetical protein